MPLGLLGVISPLWLTSTFKSISGSRAIPSQDDRQELVHKIQAYHRRKRAEQSSEDETITDPARPDSLFSDIFNTGKFYTMRSRLYDAAWTHLYLAMTSIKKSGCPSDHSRVARPDISLSSLFCSRKRHHRAQILQRWISSNAIYTRKTFDFVNIQAFLLASSALFCLSLHPRLSSAIGSFRAVLQASAPFVSCSAATRSASRHLLIPPI